MSDALSSMVKTRNVGFIVLDLRRIVRGLASGKVPNASRHFVVKKNPHVSVLRALASHGVPLRVSARAEVDFLTSLRMAHGSPSFELVEDYGFRSRKPDSFLLRMLAVGVVRFGVDAPTEVDRVERLVKKALERGTIEREPERLEYVACLGGNRAGWNEALEQLKTRVRQKRATDAEPRGPTAQQRSGSAADWANAIKGGPAVRNCDSNRAHSQYPASFSATAAYVWPLNFPKVRTASPLAKARQCDCRRVMRRTTSMSTPLSGARAASHSSSRQSVAVYNRPSREIEEEEKRVSCVDRGSTQCKGPLSPSDLPV